MCPLPRPSAGRRLSPVRLLRSARVLQRPGMSWSTQGGRQEDRPIPRRRASDLAFDSVFVKGDHHLTGPRVPGGTELAEPVFPPGDEYRVKPAATSCPCRGTAAGPCWRRSRPAGANRAFNENLANRLWAMMMGRGLVHPVDLRPSGQPAQPPGAAGAAGGGDRRAQVRRQAVPARAGPHRGLPDARSTCPREAAPLSAGVRRRAGRAEGAIGGDGGRRRAGARSTRRRSRPGIAAEDGADPAGRRAGEGRRQARRQREEGGGGPARRSPRPRRRSPAVASRQGAGGGRRRRPRRSSRGCRRRRSWPTRRSVFAKRSAAAATELAALEKASGDEGRRIARRSASERAAVGRAVEAARAKAQPVRESVRPQERRRPRGPAQDGREPDRARASPAARGRPRSVRPMARHPRASRRESRRRRGPSAAALAAAGSEPASTATVVRAPAGRGRTGRARRARRRQGRGPRPGRRSSAIGRRRRAWTRRSPPLGPRAGAPAGRRRPWPRPRASSRARPTSCRSALPRSEVPGRRGRARRSARRPRPRPRRTEALEAAGVEKARREATPWPPPGRTAAAEESRRGPADGAGRGGRGAREPAGRPIRAWPSSSRCTPEQMCWSILKVTGVYDRTRRPRRRNWTRRSRSTGAADERPVGADGPRDRGRATDLRQAQGERGRVRRRSTARAPASRRTTSSPRPTRPCSPPTAGRSTAGSPRPAGTSRSG